MNIEFLDVLYTWKVEAQQKLEALLEKQLTGKAKTERTQKMLRLEIEHAEEVMNSYSAAIRSYISHHRS
jgi:hypothetical protein